MAVLAQTSNDILTSFLAEARSFPLLRAEQERDLVQRWRDQGDEQALKLLVGSHLRLVIKIAQGNRGYGLPVTDLISEGNAGLMQAVERFDPERGFRFATYAQWWIRAAIQEYILRSTSIVRLGTTAAQKKLFFNLRRLKSRLDAYEEGDLRHEIVASIAEDLGVTTNEVVEMNRRLSGADSSLNVPIGEDGDSTHQDFLLDERDDQETLFAKGEERDKRWALVEQALAELKPRERHIVTERKLREDPQTLEELSLVYGISRERVRQIEANALRKLQQAVIKAAKACGLAGGPLLPAGA